MSKHCPKCQASMSVGLVIENKDGVSQIAKWLEGPPDRRWYGLKTRGRRQLDIVTHRCDRCGYLESYAPA